jgi:hypothetical protein
MAALWLAVWCVLAVYVTFGQAASEGFFPVPGG